MKLIVFATLLTAVFCAPSEPIVGSLIDDFKGLVDLIPVDKIKAITDEHLAHDGEFGDVIRYLQSEEWAKLVADVHSNPDWQEFVKYLDASGFQIEAVVARIHEVIKNLKPGTEASEKENLRSYLDEVEAALPLDKMVNYLLDRMQNSEDFKEFYAKISSPKAKELVEHVRALPEVQRVAAKLIKLGVRVKEFLEIVYEFLGWN